MKGGVPLIDYIFLKTLFEELCVQLLFNFNPKNFLIIACMCMYSSDRLKLFQGLIKYRVKYGSNLAVHRRAALS